MEMNRNIRVEKVIEQMHVGGYSAMLITSSANIYYLSGFSGSSGALIITEHEKLLCSDFRYKTQSAEQSPDWKFIELAGSLIQCIANILRDYDFVNIAFESDYINYSEYKILEENGLIELLTPVKNIVENIRVVKDADELTLISKAAKITDIAFNRVLEIIKPGLSEHEIAIEAEYTMLKAGASGVAFDIIIGAGGNGAKPHSNPGDYKLKYGDMVVIDMGAKYGGYCADMTRTVCVGNADDTLNEIYDVCYQAQTAALSSLRAGQRGCDVDKVARDVITMAGYGELFGHGLGHSVGIEIHENPRLSKACCDVIPSGTVITVEPGIYIPEKGGVRIEDLVVVNESGCKIITGAEKPAKLLCL